MMNLRVFLTLGILGCSLASDFAWAAPDLVISTYDSLASKAGLGGKLFPAFEKNCGCKVKVVSAGDAGTLATRLELEARRAKPSSDLILGFDETLWGRVRPHVISFAPEGINAVTPDLKQALGPLLQEGFTPFDHGVFALMHDTQSKVAPPRSLDELLLPRMKKKFLLEDPRTSTPGLAFLFFTRSQYPQQGAKGWESYWSKLSSQWLNLAPGWDQAYGMFLKGEAPLVWSYTTSEAYHQMNGDQEGRYRAVVFPDAMPVQIEGAAIVKGVEGKRLETAKKFLEFLLSKEVQTMIPEGNWMLPVRSDVQVPKPFKDLPRPSRLISLRSSGDELKDTLALWNQAIRR